MRHQLQTEQWLPYPVGTVFAFFASPMNLPPLMPPWQEARIEEAMMTPAPPPPPGAARNINAAGAGTKIILSFRVFAKAPIRLNWHARIEEFVWNDHFCDVQDNGPFAYWRHCHSVKAETRGEIEGTLLKDDLEYAFRGGPLGALVNAIAGRRQIEAIFAYRQQQALKLLPRFATMVKF